MDKRKVLKLLVKEVFIGNDWVNIKHSIPLKKTENRNKGKSYQLCTWRDQPIASESLFALCNG